MKYIFFILLFLPLTGYSYNLDHPNAKKIIANLSQKHGIEEEYVKRIFNEMKFQQSIIDSISSPAEFTWTWDRYKKLFLEEKRIKNGKKFLNDNIDALERAEEVYGVPKEIIVAILGVETRYGKIMGNYRVIDSLSTLSFDYPRRADFFSRELEELFVLAYENNLDIMSLKGSYAGAMGFGQFIASSYRAYAVDFDGDGKADLFNSIDDAIGSIGNYLYIHGWKRDGGIIKEVNLNDIRRPIFTNENLTKYVILNFTEDDQEKYFIGDDNFIAITKYNISHFYAMAVYYLSKEFKL